ncbi:MAG: phage baseplate assembly protein V [Gemmatimonadota bacterium]
MTRTLTGESGTEQAVVGLAEERQSRYYGKYRGIVQDVEDPDDRGRIVVKVPEVYGDTDSPWASPSVPFAGDSHGLVVLPEEDDGVWVEFEAGDPCRPIWTGCWWAGDEMPESASPRRRVLATTAGHRVVLDEDAGEIRLVHGDGPEFTMTGSEIKLKVGSSQIVISDGGVNINNGALEVR